MEKPTQAKHSSDGCGKGEEYGDDFEAEVCEFGWGHVGAFMKRQRR